VRLQANTAAVSEFLPEVLGKFLAGHPGIDIDLEERSSHDIVRSVAGGFADVGIVADIVDFGGLEVFPFATDRLVLVMPRGHPLARRRSLPFRESLQYEFVGMTASNALQQHLGERAMQAGRPLKLRTRLSSFEAVCRMVGSGIGVAVVPESAAARFNAERLRVARLTDSWSLRHLHGCVRSPGELHRPARELVQHLRRHARP
jgi:DNA-binding transcriptional LysR family regulator